MAIATLVGKEAAYRNAKASIDRLEKLFAQNLQDLIEEIDDHIKSLTPVNTGQAVRNYIWTTGSPNTIVFDAIDTGPTGPTNSMALGVEPRRRANEEAARATMLSLAVGQNPYQAIYLTNLSPDIVGLEAGLLPGPPLRSRSPSGMFGVTSAYIKTLIASKGMLK